MKKAKTILLALVLVLTMVLATPTMVSAQPEMETWEWTSGSSTGVTVTMNINTNNLKVDQFNIYNGSGDYLYFAVVDTSTGAWIPTVGIVVPPYTDDVLEVDVNFKRLPATDPDDPDSIRMPKDTWFWMQFPTDFR